MSDTEYSDANGDNTTSGSLSDSNHNNLYPSRYIPPHSLPPRSGQASTSHTILSTTPFDSLALGQPPLPYPKFPPPLVSFVPDGTTHFEIFLDVQQQKIEKRREHYLEQAKNVAASFGHDKAQLALFEVAPTREIIKYLDFHGEFVPELCERPPESLPVHFYIPNPDGTIPTKHFNDYIEPLLIVREIEPVVPIEIEIADLVAEEFKQEQDEKLELATDLMDNPEKFWVVTEDNWEELLPEIFSDSTVFPDLDDLTSTLKHIFAESDRQERLNQFIAERAQHLDLFKLVRVKDPDPNSYTGYTYETVIHPYAYHPATAPDFNEEDIIEGDLDLSDPIKAFKNAEKIMDNLDKLHRGEYTDATYPNSDPFAELRALNSEEKSPMSKWWIDYVIDLHRTYPDVLSDPMLQRPEFGYGALTPDFSTLHTEIKTNPIYAKHVPGLQRLIDDNERTEEDFFAMFPDFRREAARQKEHIRKLWVEPDQDYIDEVFNQITPENEHLFRDLQAEEYQRRLSIMKSRQLLEKYLSQNHPRMYRQWVQFLYKDHLSLHFGETHRQVTEMDPRLNPTYGDEVKQIEEIFKNQFAFDTQNRGDSVRLFRPPDGNLMGTEDSPIWTESPEYDPLTGESLVDDKGVLLTAADYRARKEAEALRRDEKKIKKEERAKRREERRKIKWEAEAAKRKQQHGYRSVFSYFFGSGEDPAEDEWDPNVHMLDFDDEDDSPDEYGDGEGMNAPLGPKNWDPFQFIPTPAQYLGVEGKTIPTSTKVNPDKAQIEERRQEQQQKQQQRQQQRQLYEPRIQSYARISPSDTDTTESPEYRIARDAEYAELEAQRDKLHKKRSEEAAYPNSEFLGSDEFDLLMTTSDFDLSRAKEPTPPKLDLPDLHMDTIRRKLAILNGDLEEDEEDNPLAALEEWADPDNLDKLPKSTAYMDATRYNYDQLDRDYIRRKKAADDKFGGGLESLELLHMIGDRYDRREDNLLQRADKTTAKFRQLDPDVKRLQFLRETLDQVIPTINADDYDTIRKTKAMEEEALALQAKLKERFQDEELEYHRLEWDGFKDKIDYVNDKYAKDPSNMIKKLRRQQRMHIDYDNNPIEGENFKDAYIRERIEYEQAKVKEAIADSFEHHPSLQGTIHIKDRRDLLRLTQILFSKYGGDTPKIREAISKLPIRFYMTDVRPDIDRQVQEAYIYGRDLTELGNYGAFDQQLLDTIITGMNSSEGYDAVEAEKNAQKYDNIIAMLEQDLLPSTIQSHVDALTSTEDKIELYKDVKDVTSELPAALQLTSSQLNQAQREDRDRLNKLQNQVKSYNRDLLGQGGDKVIDTYNQLYSENDTNKDKKVVQKRITTATFQDEYDQIMADVPNYQVITPSQSTPWKSWNQRLEQDGFVPRGEAERATKHAMLKRNMGRVFPSLSPDPDDDDSDQVKFPNPLDLVIDPNAPAVLRAQKQHEADYFKDKFGFDILNNQAVMPQPPGHPQSKDIIHPRHMLRWLKIPTKRRIFGEGRTHWQDEIDYQMWIRHSLPNHRIHKKGNFWDRMMIPKPSDWIHYSDKSIEEVKELIWSEEDMGAKRIRESPDTVYRVPKTRNQRLYDFLGELKRQVAPQAANDPDFIANLDPMNDAHAKYFYTQHELESQVVPTDFPEDKMQRRPRHSHLEDEVEHFRREKIEDYYQHRRDITSNHLHQDRLRKDKRLLTKQGEFEAQIRRSRFNERALGLGSFGIDIDPDDLDRNEQWEVLMDPSKAEDWFNSESTEDDPTRALRRRHPDVNLRDYDQWQVDGPAPLNTVDQENIFHKVRDRQSDPLNDYAPFQYGLAREREKEREKERDNQGRILSPDDPLRGVDIPGVDLKRYDPAFKGDLANLTTKDYAAPDQENERDSVYERYREDQFDRWRGKLLTQGKIAEKYNEATPKLPKATYLLRKQAMHDMQEQATEDVKWRRDLAVQEYAWQQGRLDQDETEVFRRRFHQSGNPKIHHFDAIPYHHSDDPNEDPYYDPAIHYQNLPAGEFMKGNPQFMAPRHEHHKARPFHTANPRPVPFNKEEADRRPKFIRESPMRNPLHAAEGRYANPTLDIDQEAADQWNQLNQNPRVHVPPPAKLTPKQQKIKDRIQKHRDSEDEQGDDERF